MGGKIGHAAGLSPPAKKGRPFGPKGPTGRKKWCRRTQSGPGGGTKKFKGELHWGRGDQFFKRQFRGTRQYRNGALVGRKNQRGRAKPSQRARIKKTDVIKKTPQPGTRRKKKTYLRRPAKERKTRLEHGQKGSVQGRTEGKGALRGFGIGTW